jgi:hypothetical protein
MTFDPKPLLKGFGAAADVAGQIATDKAVNSRRTRSDFSQYDITKGQLLTDLTLETGEDIFPHSLGRVPTGAFVLKAGDSAVCVSTTLDTVSIKGTAADIVTVWVV